MNGERAEQDSRAGRPLLVALAGYTLFAGAGYVARFVPLAFHAMGIVGFLLPLVWGLLSGRWREMGFTKENWRGAILWGLGAGVATSLVGLATTPSRHLSGSLGFQMIVGVPFAFLLASPFQELFFRGWLQTRCEAALGKVGGLLTSTALFLLWHYLTPFSVMPGFAYPLDTAAGFLGTLLAGLIYGYAFQRSRSIIAPWLAHALAHVTFAAVGVVVFADVVPWAAGG